MFVRFGQILMIVALLAATGAHWAALQSVAWTAMLAKNLESGSFSQAVSDTFDGRHLCPLCKAIRAGKAAEKKLDFTLDIKKFEFPPATTCLALFAPAHFQLLPELNTFAESLNHRPLTPPPRPDLV